MKLFETIGRAALKFLPYGEGSGSYSYGWGRFNKLTDPWPREIDRQGDRRTQDNLFENGPVAICLGVIGDQFPEPRLEVVEQHRNGKEVVATYHDLPFLIEQANPFDTSDQLWYHTVACQKAEGNAYWFVRRNELTKEPAEIRFEPPWLMAPKPKLYNGNTLPRDYIYRADGQKID